MASAAVTVSAPKKVRNSRVKSAGSEVLAWVERRLGLTPAGLSVTVAMIVLFFGSRIIKSRGMALFAYGLAMVMVISWLLGRRNLPVTADRADLPPRVRAKRTVDAGITLTARRRVSGIIVEEEMDEHLGAPVRLPVPILPTGQSVTHPYQFTPTMRGIYKVGPLVAEWSDPFGLTRRRQQIAAPTDIIVHPRSEPVLDRIISREWEDPPIRPPFLKPWPTGFEFYGLRDYVDGDDPRRIVWRAVAQYDKYVVREAEQGITDRVNIWLDSDNEFHSPGRDSETFEAAVSVAASLASKHLKDGFSVSLHINSGALATLYRGQRKIIPLLDHLAAVKRESKAFTDAIDRLFSDPDRKAHNLLITPHVTRETASRLRLLLDRGTSLLVVVVLWDDTDPMTLHRAGSLGCPVVEISGGIALATLFANVVTSRRR